MAGFSKSQAHVCSLMMKVRKEPVSKVDCTLLGKAASRTFSSNARLMKMLRHALDEEYLLYIHFTPTLPFLLNILKEDTLSYSLLIKRSTCGDSDFGVLSLLISLRV